MPVIDFRPRVDDEVERIKTSEKLSNRNRDLLLDYKQDMKIDGLSHSRIYKVLVHTKKLAEQLDGVDLDETSRGISRIW